MIFEVIQGYPRATYTMAIKVLIGLYESTSTTQFFGNRLSGFIKFNITKLIKLMVGY